MDRTTWLDGLRGIAAAIVATDHYFMGGVLDAAFLSYWADPPEENRHFYQLPPIRLLFAAHAMVPLFLVISGYAISINLLRIRNSSNNTSSDDLLRRLASATTRRILRIYLPVLAIAAISQLLYFCNIYQWTFGDEVVFGRRPWTAPWFHITYLFRYMLDIMNILNFQGNPGLNGQLWTMPMEFRGSCVVYITVLGLAFWRPPFRRLALLGMMAYWFYFGLWDIFGFLAGLYLAERRVTSSDSSETGEEKTKLLPYNIPMTFQKDHITKLAKLRTALCFIFGIHLLCLSDDGYLPPGYQFLGLVESSRWEGDWAIISKCWKTAGAALTIYAISKSNHYLQRPLRSGPIQYLGRISFALYLVHQSVYHLIRDPVRKFLWLLLAREPYPGTSNLVFGVVWFVNYGITAVVNVYLADLFTRLVDVKCVELAKRIERWITR